jgi:chorismate mutase
MSGADLPQDLHRELAAYRSTIDRLDAELVRILGERFAVTERVGYLKARHDLPTLDASREGEQLSRLRELADQVGVRRELVEAVFGEITRTVRLRHDELRTSRSRAADTM